MDDDLDHLSREELADEVRRLRHAIREHRDSTGHDLCWHHPAMWGLLPEQTDPARLLQQAAHDATARAEADPDDLDLLLGPMRKAAMSLIRTKYLEKRLQAQGNLRPPQA